MTTLLTHAAELKLILHAAEKYALRRGCSCVEDVPEECASCRVEDAVSRLETELRVQEVDALRRRMLGAA